MKSKSAILAIIFLIAINTSFLWERLPSGWDFILTLFFAPIGLLLVMIFLWKFTKLFIEKFKNRNNVVSVIIIGSVLTFCFFFPLGLIRNTDFDPDYFLIASREGAANCQTTIILGIDKTFVQRNVCFGVDKEIGTYEIKNDTVYMSFQPDQKFGRKEAIGVIDWKEDGKEGNYGYFNYYRIDSKNNSVKLMITYLKK